MRVIVAGGRDLIPNKNHVRWLIDTLLKLGTTEVICGMAKGADTLGKQVALKMNIPVKEFPADWNKYGRSAGPIRNAEMAKNADACILFPGGNGTANMKMLATVNKLKIMEYENGYSSCFKRRRL